ncbi:MAG: Threonylcarbamoyl-AMP synthase [Deltaproteobacteria bacterium]|nr:Threonylcarbamoyl-AMP synthase [Deltaproteobacteria bacterium]
MLINYPFSRKSEHIVSEYISGNQILAFPTETIYGLGGNAFSKNVVDRIFSIKDRPRNKPLPLLITTEWLHRLCKWNDSRINNLIEVFWPGPLTLILECKHDLPEHLKNNSGTLAVRFSSSHAVQRLVEIGECPIIGTSANRSGFPACSSAKKVETQLKDQVDLVIDGGETSGNLASTIVNCLTEPFKIVRNGIISSTDLNQICEVQQ